MARQRRAAHDEDVGAVHCDQLSAGGGHARFDRRFAEIEGRGHRRGRNAENRVARRLARGIESGIGKTGENEGVRLVDLALNEIAEWPNDAVDMATFPLKSIVRNSWRRGPKYQPRPSGQAMAFRRTALARMGRRCGRRWETET